MLVVLTETYCDKVNNQVTQRGDFIFKKNFEYCCAFGKSLCT